MEENVNHLSVGSIEGDGQAGNQLPMEEKQELIKFYSKQLGMLFPLVQPGISDEAKLVMLQKKNIHFIDMLTLFTRPWADEITVIQKAILQYLSTEGIPRKERARIIQVWGDWTNFLLNVSRYQGLLTRYLQYQHRQASELEKLLKQDQVLFDSEIRNVN